MGERDDGLDWSRLADSEFLVVQHFGSDGGFIEGRLICQGRSWSTTFLPPGTRCGATETDEQVLSWTAAQWRTTTAGPDPPTELGSKPVLPSALMRALPMQLKDWVRQASTTGLRLLDFLAETEPESQRRDLIRRKRDELGSQLESLPPPGAI
jgi:hypothetical protein